MKVAWFSAGITSAVACKYAVDLYSDVEIYYIETGSAHPDNKRFISECESWYQKKINIIQNSKGYTSHFDVVEKTRYVNGVGGARCTLELKKNPRFELEQNPPNNLPHSEVQFPGNVKMKMPNRRRKACPRLEIQS